MDNIGYVQYICLLIPMLLSLFALEKKSRIVIGYMLIGATVCMFISEFNGFLYTEMKKDMLYFCTAVSPITEEIIKALPVLFFALFFSDKRQDLMQISFATGLGFAIMESTTLLTQNLNNINIVWAVVRGFGAGLMHSVCTIFVGLGISFVKKKRKLFLSGLIALLMLAITYHSIYNTIVMSDYKYFGFVLPLATYLPILYFNHTLKVRKKRDVTQQV